MMRFFNEEFPDFKLPLKKKTIWKKGNKGYGSGLDDYRYATVYHIDENDMVWFIEYSEQDIFADNLIDVNERFETMYDLFGKSNFEKFVNSVFNIKLEDRGEGKYDWMFTDMDYVIVESGSGRRINERVIDKINDEKLINFIGKLVREIYGKDLTMDESESGYLRFYSKGPIPPYHRNLAGVLWIDDDRLVKLVSRLLSTDMDETFAIISVYFSHTYNIKVAYAKALPSANFWGRYEDDSKYDYSKFDDENYEEEIDEDVVNENVNQIRRRLPKMWEGIHYTYPWQYPCDFHSLGHFSIALRAELFESYEIIDSLDLDLFNSDESYIWNMIVKAYGNKIKEHYEGWCGGEEKTISESKSFRIKRVLHVIREFIDHLDADDICSYWDRDEGDKYINGTMGDLVYYLTEEHFKESDYDELYDELVDYGVRQDITEFFYDTIDSCTE